jgi:competence protein ComEC
LAFVAGAWCLQQQPALVDGRTAAIGGLVACGVAAAAAHLARREAAASRFRGAPRAVLRAVALLAAFAVGFAWASWRAEQRLADELPHVLEGRDLVVVGTVATLPFVDARGTRFELTVESVVSRDEHGDPLRVPAHLGLGWYSPRSNGSGRAGVDVPDLRPGQRWRLTVRLKRPHGAANPFGFDFEYWMLEEGLRGSGYVRPGIDADETDATDEEADASPRQATSTKKLDDFVWSANNVVERVRTRLRDRVITVLADGGAIAVNAPYAGVIVALIVGDQRAIP